ncbi:MAG: OmpH family outer membrane protein [Rhodovarius sp.]|nr:OmpH family outer membrane protein [Rhodovarius sp.]MCX7931760.1 OmpH family outer membrane protein [Rhodovarius sp.]MDW8314467.1 OmpH family outer membrane protein [Rhodovarius sp.]
MRMIALRRAGLGLRGLLLSLIALGPAVVAGLAAPAGAQQQDPGFFVPGQQRPAQQGQRPTQGQAQQRPPARPDAPPPLPPGQRPPEAVIGIVDIGEVQRVSTAVNQLREELERRRARLNEDLQREQNAWREAQQQLAAERASLPPDVLRQRERDLQERISESQRIFRNRGQAIEQAVQQAGAEIEERMADVIRQVAQSRGINIVLPRPMVLMNEAPFDLTAEVAQQLNRVMPRVTVPPETDGRTAATPPGAPATPRAQPAPQPRVPQPQR